MTFSTPLTHTTKSINSTRSNISYISIIGIAKVCHEANRAYCETLGDTSQVAWEVTSNWQIESTVKGVEFCLKNPGVEAEVLHSSWMREKMDMGWTYGPVKDLTALTHPCLLPFHKLPQDQQLKITLFLSIVRTFSLR